MTIGPITLRWTKAVAKEQHDQDYHRRMTNSMIDQQMGRIVKLRAIIERWGLETAGRPLEKAKPPKGAGVSI